jgi:hypothetical protein
MPACELDLVVLSMYTEGSSVRTALLFVPWTSQILSEAAVYN